MLNAMQPKSDFNAARVNGQLQMTHFIGRYAYNRLRLDNKNIGVSYKPRVGGTGVSDAGGLAVTIPVLEKAVDVVDATSIDIGAVDQTPDDYNNIKPPVIGVAGGGIFFFWEVGVLKYLLENFNLKYAEFTGVSAGALCAVLVCSGVDLDRCVKKAYDLSLENSIWDRPGGLAGIWGGLVREWLESLLPEDAHEVCSSRVKIVATRVPRMNLEYLDQFSSREDLINACMASVHIPFFLDGNGVYSYRGKQYIDGSVWDFFSGTNSKLVTKNNTAQVIDYFDDDQLQFNRLDFVKIASYESVLDLVQSGYSYAERTDAKGLYEEKLGVIRKGMLQRAFEYPIRKGRTLLKI